MFSKMIIMIYIFNYKWIRLIWIHKKNYIHHDLHSGNIFSYSINNSSIGDLGLCQQLDDTNEIFGVIPYLAPEVLSGKPYTEKSDIYSLGMIMWEYTTGKKPFYNRSHNHCLILDILEGKRPEITEDTPEFYAGLMKKCWDPKSEKYLIDEKNHKNHPESFYTSRPLSKLVQQANSLKLSSNDNSINNLSIPKNFG